jgi:hypothetical protein
MDYKFLDKVLDHIVSETSLDYNERTIDFSSSFLYSSPLFFSSFPLLLTSPLFFQPFSKHCKEVYGLDQGEIEYLWEEYKRIIMDKINNG